VRGVATMVQHSVFSKPPLQTFSSQGTGVDVGVGGLGVFVGVGVLVGVGVEVNVGVGYLLTRGK